MQEDSSNTKDTDAQRKLDEHSQSHHLEFTATTLIKDLYANAYSALAIIIHLDMFILLLHKAAAAKS